MPALHLYMRITYSTLLTCPSFAPLYKGHLSMLLTYPHFTSLYEGYLQHTADLS